MTKLTLLKNYIHDIALHVAAIAEKLSEGLDGVEGLQRPFTNIIILSPHIADVAILFY